MREIDLSGLCRPRGRRGQRPVPLAQWRAQVSEEHYPPSRLWPVRPGGFVRATRSGHRPNHRCRVDLRSLRRRGPHYADLRPPRLSGTRPGPGPHAHRHPRLARNAFSGTDPHCHVRECQRRPLIRAARLPHYPILHRRRLARLNINPPPELVSPDLASDLRLWRPENNLHASLNLSNRPNLFERALKVAAKDQRDVGVAVLAPNQAFGDIKNPLCRVEVVEIILLAE